jgi:hypothetical protein
MGYRSDVMVLIYPDVDKQEDEAATYEQLKMLMGTTFKDVADVFGEDMTWYDDEHVLKFAIEDVKWYPSFSDVQSFEAMLHTLRGYDDDGIKGYCTEFVRIGEDSDDLEETHTGENNQYYLQIRRTIECNV